MTGGKTTLTRLLLRMMDADDGRILIGGQDITKLRQSDLRSLIAYVPQDPAMFHRTLRENIAFARPDATDTQIQQAAQAAHVTEFADTLPDGFDTMVGERGVDQLVVLDRGQIAEKGTHQELLRLDGTYARLWQHQSGGFLEDDMTTAMLAQAPRLSA